MHSYSQGIIVIEFEQGNGDAKLIRISSILAYFPLTFYHFSNAVIQDFICGLGLVVYRVIINITNLQPAQNTRAAVFGFMKHQI